MARKLYIKTFGCQMNEYDSDKISDVLAESHNLELTTHPEEADVLLLNTCSIREKAQEKVFSQLGRWKTWKQDRPDLVIGVGGCVASQEGDAIQQRAPYVDMVFGPQTIHRLPQMLDALEQRVLVGVRARGGLPQPAAAWLRLPSRHNATLLRAIVLGALQPTPWHVSV